MIERKTLKDLKIIIFYKMFFFNYMKYKNKKKISKKIKRKYYIIKY